MTDLYERLRAFVGQEATPVRHAQDPVNRAMIRHYVEAVGDGNPRYLAEGVAPPAMLPVWLMVGFRAHQGGRRLGELLELLDEHGFTGVVATDDEQTYLRELREGDDLSMRTVVVDVSPLKQTSLGPGHFVTTRRTYVDQHGETVAEQLFRILRFAPGAPMKDRPKPFVTRDNAFWFAAARDRRLVIQACDHCGRLRHPPAPVCPHCRSFDWHEVESTGRGTVHSYVISHHPKAPGFDHPHAVVLADLDEGTRLVADFDGDHARLAVGLPVRVEWLRYDDDVTLPRFRPVEG
jgi:uncharacterized OB-fold protein